MHSPGPRGPRISKPGEALARALALRGLTCDREHAAQLADFLLDAVASGVLVPPAR